MLRDLSVPDRCSGSARAHLDAASGGAGEVAPGRCPVCGASLADRPRARVCSGRCRAELARRRQAERLEARDREIRGLLEEALRRLSTP